MERPDKNKVSEVAGRVIEDMAFLFLSPDGEMEPDFREVTSAVVPYSGPVSGKLSLTMPDSLLPLVTANMLGEEPGFKPSSAQQFDALGELANVVTGNLLGEAAGEGQVFDLGSPKFTNDYPNRFGEDEVHSSAVIHLEDGWAEVSLVMSE